MLKPFRACLRLNTIVPILIIVDQNKKMFSECACLFAKSYGSFKTFLSCFENCLSSTSAYLQCCKFDQFSNIGTPYAQYRMRSAILRNHLKQIYNVLLIDVPYGKTGRDFIDQITKHNNDWNNGTEMEQWIDTPYAQYRMRSAILRNHLKQIYNILLIDVPYGKTGRDFID